MRPGCSAAHYRHRNTLSIVHSKIPFQVGNRLVLKAKKFSEFVGIKIGSKPIMTAESVVQSAISENKVIMFSKTYCPYCTMAKNALGEFVKDYAVMEINKRKDSEAIQDVLEDMTGERTVPRVFIGGKFIGGGTECVSELLLLAVISSADRQQWLNPGS
eukprot:Gregarina_sp_Poly_1__5704@NODE_2_length_28028_cov_167_134223_g1_i0_p19_GENE_NODE_2_length_28028_cov_167_134223_g1_i0NODE_2_length_28028_cov_167_134223_g1_i0_p19_ORF_typecomplete_len159_score14_25Glutaredoxin/PF00462_24/1e04Glutaredoxin/PF00462_24/2_2e17Thioredoxin_3/PF13192_6/0_0013DUF836/PF05768_14/0_0063Thioredoxin_4/PF13462_6/0_1Thioredoxin_4/PF13462_6/1_6e02Thioredoxin_2/PF13098_6/0_013TraF/PF13728_6/0_024Thioredoxin/PF00085_20/0_089DSBA/PF01323_20/0_39DSBA/PF01323_20/1_9e03Z1/PF10593_9/0_16